MFLQKLKLKSITQYYVTVKSSDSVYNVKCKKIYLQFHKISGIAEHKFALLKVLFKNGDNSCVYRPLKTLTRTTNINDKTGSAKVLYFWYLPNFIDYKYNY